MGQRLRLPVIPAHIAHLGFFASGYDKIPGEKRQERERVCLTHDPRFQSITVGGQGGRDLGLSHPIYTQGQRMRLIVNTPMVIQANRLSQHRPGDGWYSLIHHLSYHPKRLHICASDF